MYGATAFDFGNATYGLVRVVVADAWDGTDSNAVAVDGGLAYPFEVTVLTARIPETAECAEGETLRNLSFDEVQVVAPVIEPPMYWASNSICCVMSLNQFASNIGRPGTLDQSAFKLDDDNEWEKENDCARTCTEAYAQCACTDMGSAQGDVGQTRCDTCRNKCNRDGDWPASTDNSLSCNFRVYLYETSLKRPQPTCID